MPKVVKYQAHNHITFRHLNYFLLFLFMARWKPMYMNPLCDCNCTGGLKKTTIQTFSEILAFHNVESREQLEYILYTLKNKCVRLYSKTSDLFRALFSTPHEYHINIDQYKGPPTLLCLARRQHTLSCER